MSDAQTELDGSPGLAAGTSTTDTTVAAGDGKIGLSVTFSDVGPCRKLVNVVVPRSEIDQAVSASMRQLIVSTPVPGFRKGRVPRSLIQRKFREEIRGNILQRVLLTSLERLSNEHSLDAVDEPNLDVESLVIPEEGDFEFSFEVEVRPQFELPDFATIEFSRPVREISDAEIQEEILALREQHSTTKVPVDTPAELDDFVTVELRSTFKGEELVRRSGVEVRVRPILMLSDTRIDGFDAIMRGVVVGDQRRVSAKVSMEATRAELRGETVELEFVVTDVRRQRLADISQVETNLNTKPNQLEALVRNRLQARFEFQQRESVREQLSGSLSASQHWDLPESMVLRQVENAMRRITLEMRESGFTDSQIANNVSVIRQNQISTTRAALKQHFVLDRLATREGIEVSPAEVQQEIVKMAANTGESVRRVKVSLERSELLENLHAQIRERKAIDHILKLAKTVDVQDPWKSSRESSSVNLAVT